MLRQCDTKHFDYSWGDSGLGVDSDLNINKYDGYFLATKAL